MANDVANAAAKPAGQLADALASQAKGAYGFFANANQTRMLRHCCIHMNFAGFAGRIPKAITLLVPAQIASGQADDPLQADPAIMSPNMFVMPDPSMRAGASPR